MLHSPNTRSTRRKSSDDQRSLSETHNLLQSSDQKRISRELSNLPVAGGRGGRKHDDTGKWNFNDDTTQECCTKNSFPHGPSYHLMDIDALENFMNEVCVCRCVVERSLEDFLSYCSTIDKQMTIGEARHHIEKWKERQKLHEELEINVKNIGLAADFAIECQKCNNISSIPNETTKYHGKNYDGDPCHNYNCSWFSTNIKLVLGTLASGMGATDISTLFSFLGLPTLRSFSKRQFSRIEGLIGIHLREVADKSMEDALDIEVRHTQINKKMKIQDWRKSENPIGLTLSYDMGWSKRSSGHRYDSISGHAFMVGCHSKKILARKVTSTQCSFCNKYEKRDEEVPEHDCPRNYYGSSKAMEADTALELVKKLDTTSGSKLFVEAMVTDDDSSIRAIVSHDNSRNKKGKGKLPQHIPEPQWLADPTHRTRVVARAIYCLAHSNQQVSKCKPIDAHRFKKYFGYMLAQTRNGTLDEMSVKCLAVIEHLFDDHSYCDPKWCRSLRLLEEEKNKSENTTFGLSYCIPCNTSPADNEVKTTFGWTSFLRYFTSPDDNEDNMTQYENIRHYRSKTDDRELYEQMWKAYRPYITLERLKQMLHNFSTQINEALNNVVAKYAPKNRTYAMTMSLQNRVAIVTGIHNMGHLGYWHEVYKRIQLPMTFDMRQHLQRLDRAKDVKRKYNSRTEVKSKQRKLNNEKMQELLKRQKQDAKRGSFYSSGIGVQSILPKAVLEKELKILKNPKITCKLYGCYGQTHKSSKSKKCRYYGCDNDEKICSAVDERMRELHPEEYPKMP